MLHQTDPTHPSTLLSQHDARTFRTTMFCLSPTSNGFTPFALNTETTHCEVSKPTPELRAQRDQSKTSVQFSTDCHLFGFHFISRLQRSRDSSVGIATRYGAGRSGDWIPVGGAIFRTRPDRLWGPPSLLHNRYRVFTGGKVAGASRWPPTAI